MIVSRTHYRCSLFGGSTDQPAHFLKHGGAVLTTTISHYIDIVLYRKEAFSGVWSTVQWSRGVEQVSHPDQIEHDLVREAVKFLGFKDGFEMHMRGSITSKGTGLGSSGAACVGILNALHTAKGEQVPAETLAKEACHIEIHLLQRPIGPQDQYAAAFGGASFLNLLPGGKVMVEKLNVPDHTLHELDHQLLYFFTGSTRNAAEVLKDQAAQASEADKVAIRGEMRDLAHQAKQWLLEGKLEELGRALNHEWALKQRLGGEVSNGAINQALETALTNGAIGGKLSGGGGGGFLLLFVPPDAQGRVRAALRDQGLEEMRFHLSPHGSRILVHLEEARV